MNQFSRGESFATKEAQAGKEFPINGLRNDNGDGLVGNVRNIDRNLVNIYIEVNIDEQTDYRLLHPGPGR